MIKWPQVGNWQNEVPLQLWIANRLKAIEIKLEHIEGLTAEEKEFVKYIAEGKDMMRG